VVERIGRDFGVIHDSVRVHCDSQSAIHLTKDHIYHKYHKQMKHIKMKHIKMKQIDVTYHKIRKWVIDGKVIDLVKVSTKKSNRYEDEDHPG